ncbi:helix-turn-helix domain-containing protein [Nitrobacteraceae bacterium UC4446_H13]
MTKTIGTKSASEIDRQVGERIRAARLGAGLSQEKLGAALGLTFQQVQKYEKGSNRVGPARLFKIAEVCGTDAATLLGCNDATPAPVVTMMATRDGQDLATAFNRITSADDRRVICHLAARFADIEGAPLLPMKINLQAAE